MDVKFDSVIKEWKVNNSHLKFICKDSREIQTGTNCERRGGRNGWGRESIGMNEYQKSHKVVTDDIRRSARSRDWIDGKTL